MCKEYFDYLAKTYENEIHQVGVSDSQSEEMQGVIQEILNQNCKEMYGG